MFVSMGVFSCMSAIPPTSHQANKDKLSKIKKQTDSKKTNRLKSIIAIIGIIFQMKATYLKKKVQNLVAFLLWVVDKKL